MRGAVQRILTIAGRGCVAALAFALVLHGSTKRPPLRRSTAPASPEVTDADVARGYRLVSVATNAALSYVRPAHAAVHRPWGLRGAYEDRFWLGLGDFAFPLGTGVWTRLSVSAWGEARPALRDRVHSIAAAGGPMSAVPGRSEFWWAEGEGGSCVLTWRDFAPGRDASASLSAQLVLYPTGDFLARSNGVERAYRRVDPFDWDGDGIPNADDPAPRRWDGNFLGQAESVRARIARLVGSGARNGLYRLRVTLPDAPARRTLLAAGTNRVVAAEAGDFDFLLEKGVAYALSVEPDAPGAVWSAADDVGGASRSAAQTAAAVASGAWTAAGGGLSLVPPSGDAPGSVLWMPSLEVSPGVAHLGPGEPDPVFTATLADAPPGLPVSYRWTADDPGLLVSDPSARTVRVTPAALPNWREATLTVTATAGTNALTSVLRLTYGRSRHPQVRLSLSAPRGVFERGALGRLSVGFSSDVPTNGTLRLDGFARSGEVRLWADPGRSVPVHLPLVWDAADFTGFGCFVAGVSVCSNLDDVVFSLAYDDGRGATSRIKRAMTCARVSRVEIGSEVAGLSATPPPFDGQVPNPFDERRSPVPDRHLPVFFGTVWDGESVRDFAVDIRLVISPSDYREPGAEARWFRLGRTPESGDLLPVSDVAAELRNPRVGGVYRIGAVYGGSPTNECVIVLPLAGASVDAMVRRNLSAADLVVERIKKKYPARKRASLKNGKKWFWSHGAGDFHGRPDNARSPTVWVYNQVNERTGMGAVATWGGLPIRVAKLSNFWFGYVGTRLEIPYYRLWLAQYFGTSNDESAALSWRAGRELALGGDYGTVVSNLVREAFTESDGKNVRLWPNLLPLDNEVNFNSNRNFNAGFSAPGLVNFGDDDL